MVGVRLRHRCRNAVICTAECHSHAFAGVHSNADDHADAHSYEHTGFFKLGQSSTRSPLQRDRRPQLDEQ